LLAKLDVAVVATIRRSRGWRATNDSPSPISSRRGRRPSRDGGVSRCRIRPSSSADSTNDSASTRMTSGAPTARTSRPPTAGPTTAAADCETCSRALPSLIRDDGTSEGR
jgi:hypothetical protein